MAQAGHLQPEANPAEDAEAIRPKDKHSPQNSSRYSEGYFLILIGQFAPQHTADNSSSNLVRDRAT